MRQPAFDTVVMKFGGSSVADPEKIRHVAQRFVDAKRRGLKVVGTVSAMGKTTDQLLALASDVSPTPNPRELDMLLSTGERIACALVAMAIHDLGEEAVSFTGSQAGILTDSVHTKAKIREIRGDRIRAGLEQGKIVLVAGFQGFSRDTMDVTTLGRGGTDATAVALAAALGGACEIYSDVPGVFTADPRIVPDARKLAVVSYDEMLEMAASGAKVLMLRSVELARSHGVRIHARSTFSDEEGTWVQEAEGMEQPIVSAVTHSETDVVGAGRGRARDAGCDRGDPGGARRVRGRGEPRARQGVADRGRDAVASRRRRDDVPHACRPRDQPRDDLDVADQDQLHDRARPHPRGGAEPARRLPPGARARGRADDLRLARQAGIRRSGFQRSPACGGGTS
jgi:uridylate kinase